MKYYIEYPNIPHIAEISFERFKGVLLAKGIVEKGFQESELEYYGIGRGYKQRIKLAGVNYWWEDK